MTEVMTHVDSPADIASLRAYAIAFIHHSLWLVINHFAVVISLPRAVVLFERRAPES